MERGVFFSHTARVSWKMQQRSLSLQAANRCPLSRACPRGQSGACCMKRERIYPEREKTVSLGSGLIIFKRRETGYAGGTEASHAYPVLSFRKSVGAYQTVLSPFPRCPVWMPGVSSTASSTSSSTDFSERMHLMSTARTKRCAIALSGGAGLVFSTKFSLSWQTKYLLMAP